VLVEKARGFWESVLAGAILSVLRAFVVPRKLGVVAGADGMVRLFPDMNLIRMPDVAFVSWERLEACGTERRSVPQVAPDLAVEVLSEGNTPAEMRRKRQEYFDAGVRLVWVVDPTARTIDAYAAVDQRVTLREGQLLDGGSVLPGFALELTVLFAEVDR
jgi:Uma2 family endonuclease